MAQPGAPRPPAGGSAYFEKKGEVHELRRLLGDAGSGEDLAATGRRAHRPLCRHRIDSNIELTLVVGPPGNRPSYVGGPHSRSLSGARSMPLPSRFADVQDFRISRGTPNMEF